MSDSKSLKEKNWLMLTMLVLVQGLLVAWLLLDVPISKAALEKLGSVDWQKAGSGLALALLAQVLNGLVPSSVKDTIVFLRWRRPLPGHRAFNKLVAGDARIDAAHLRERLGGAFPQDPDEQNRVWYRLYKRHGDDAAVSTNHREYLLLRDLTWLTTLIALAGTVLFLFFRRNMILAFVCIECVLWLLIRIAAATAGERFVRTVLACESHAQEEKTKCP